MKDSKNAIASKTIIGLAVLLISGYGRQKGIIIDEVGLTQELGAVVTTAGELFGAAMVVWGRLTANKPVHILPKWLRR